MSYKISRWKYFKTRSKYNNQKAEYKDIKYDSKFESKVAQDLDLRLMAKDIKKIERQVKISLDVNGMHIANYYIDFIITHNDDTLEYIEVKGYETEVWRLKWKLCEALLQDELKKDLIKMTVIKR